MINPARKAPRPRDKPARDVIQATARQMATMLSKKSSRSRVLAML